MKLKATMFFLRMFFFRDDFSESPSFVADNGFFYNIVFTEHNICKGFFILKPNGHFYKYYGEDYYYRIKDAILADEN